MIWRIDDPKRLIEQIRLVCDEDENGCWIWPECLDWNGRDRRPTLNIISKIKKSVAYWILWAKTGEIQEVARHICDVGCCCNPDHLVWGTHADNGRDRVERDRSAFGERNPASKLIEEQVIEILNSHDSYSELGEKYGVKPDTIGRIKRGQNWKRVFALHRNPNQSKPRTKKAGTSTTSKFQGVNWDKSRDKWVARISFNGRKINLGRYDNEETAAYSYDIEARKIYGTGARLNFPGCL